MRRRKWWKVALPAFVIMALLLSACGSSPSISEGAQKMKTTLADMKKDLDAGKTDGLKAKSDELEKSWSQFEDSVKDKDKTLYGKVEDPLGLIEAGAKKSAPDAAVLKKAVDDLNAVLADVEKLK